MTSSFFVRRNDQAILAPHPYRQRRFTGGHAAMVTTPDSQVPTLWQTTPLPHGWQWARPHSGRDARAAGRLVSRNMRAYWKARGMRFSLPVFLKHWPTQQSLLWRPRHRVHGLLSWTCHKEHAHLCEFQLDEGYRGQGMGTALLAQWLLECYRQGVRSVELRVFRDNPAYHLYSRFGFWALAVDTDIPGFMTMRCRLDRRQCAHIEQLARQGQMPLSLSA